MRNTKRYIEKDIIPTCANHPKLCYKYTYSETKGKDQIINIKCEKILYTKYKEIC